MDIMAHETSVHTMPSSPPPSALNFPDRYSPTRMMAIPAKLLRLGNCFRKIRISGTMTIFRAARALTVEAGRISRPSFSKRMLPVIRAPRITPLRSAARSIRRKSLRKATERISAATPEVRVT